MKFVSAGIGKLVMKELATAAEVRMAVAFFNPNDRMLDALVRIARLTLVVSEEFEINNPYKLERLKSAVLRSIPSDSESGKLHAKIFVIKRRNGSHWILLGSANATHQGMFANQEACVVLESANTQDQQSVREVQDWFGKILKSARMPNLGQAKSIFDARSQYQIVPRPSVQPISDVKYWALKPPPVQLGSNIGRCS